MIDTVTNMGSPTGAGAVPPRTTARESATPPAAKPDTAHAVMPAQAAAGDGPALKKLEEEINGLIESLLASNLRLRIEADAATGVYVYQGVDRQTGEVKKQWPPEKILHLRAFFRELDGLLVDKSA